MPLEVLTDRYSPVKKIVEKNRLVFPYFLFCMCVHSAVFVQCCSHCSTSRYLLSCSQTHLIQASVSSVAWLLPHC